MVKNAVRHCCLLILGGVLLNLSMPAIANSHHISALKVAYIYNIAKFTRWPATTWTNVNSPFQLCYYAKGHHADALQSLENKEINGHPIHLLKAVNKADFKQCHAFYINTEQRHRYRYLLSLINSQSVLIISDDSPFFEYGGLINLVEKNQRLRFQVNTQELKASQLRFSSKLLKLAILIDYSR